MKILSIPKKSIITFLICIFCFISVSFSLMMNFILEKTLTINFQSIGDEKYYTFNKLDKDKIKEKSIVKIKTKQKEKLKDYFIQKLLYLKEFNIWTIIFLEEPLNFEENQQIILIYDYSTVWGYIFSSIN